MGKTEEIRDEKPWYKSKTLIAMVATLLIQILNMTTGLGVDAEEMGEKIANLNWEAPLTAILALLGIFGRVTAKRKISGLFDFLKKKKK